MRQRFLTSILIAASLTNTYALQATLYTTQWSEYGANHFPVYQYDGAYDSQKGSWNNRPVVSNPSMVAQFNHSDVVVWSFMQAWNSQDPNQAKYGVSASWDGLLHFSDLYGDLPPSNDPNARSVQSTCNNVLGAAACAAVQINGNTGQRQLFNYIQDDTTGQFNSFNAFIKSPKYTAKRIIAVGGANTSDNKSVAYYTFQAIFSHQDKFVANLQKWQQAYPNLKGFDYDFEPPISASGGQLLPSEQTYKDYASLLSLVKKTRAALGKEAYISVTLTPNLDYLQYINAADKDVEGKGDWFKQIARYATVVNIMTYDLHGPWSHSADPLTALHAYLAQPNIPNINKFSIQYGAEKVINTVLSYGMPADQLQMGVANYGRAFSGVPNKTIASTNLFGFDQPWVGAAKFPGDISKQAGMLPYKFVSQLVSQGYSQYEVHQVLGDASTPVVGAYLFNPNAATPNVGTFVGYESPAEVRAACVFAKEKHLHGMIFWDAASDLPVSDPASLLATFAVSH